MEELDKIFILIFDRRIRFEPKMIQLRRNEFEKVEEKNRNGKW